MVFKLSEQELWRSAVLGFIWILLGAYDPTPGSLLPTRVQKKTSQSELSADMTLWGRSYESMLLWQSLGPATSPVPPDITQWAASPRR